VTEPQRFWLSNKERAGGGLKAETTKGFPMLSVVKVARTYGIAEQKLEPTLKPVPVAQ
jgi:hypothetical protein